MTDVDSWYFRNSVRLAAGFTAVGLALGILIEPAVGVIVGLIAMRFWLNSLYRVYRHKRTSNRPS